MNRLLRLARPLAFLLGAALSLLAIYAYLATARMVLADPAVVLPDETLWTAEQLQSTLQAMRLPGGFFAVYVLGITLLFSLTFHLCGWLILLRRSQDWFGLYLGLILLGWANGLGVFVSIPPVSPWLETVHSYLGWLIWPGMFLLLYLFPNGHIVPRWARWFAGGWGLFAVYGFIATIFDALPEEFFYFIPLLFVVLVIGGYAQIYRYRHAGALERQQVKIVVFSLILFVAYFVTFAVIVNFTGLGVPSLTSPAGAFIYHLILSSVAYLVFMSVPVSITVAMLRYRLWDVDIVIRRTLIYGALTATLALVYFGSVILMQSLFEAVSGQRSAVAIVISTLAIAALFTPLRRRIQNDIDRRFFRRKYDAEKVVAAFGASLREEVDLDDLQVQIVAVVQETLQPEAVGLWLRPSLNKNTETSL